MQLGITDIFGILRIKNYGRLSLRFDGLLIIIALLILVIYPVVALSKESSLPKIVRGTNISDCADRLNSQDGGWCEIRTNDTTPSISAVWPNKLDKKTRMITGPKSILTAWNSAAYDEKEEILYFMGGGHADYGGNEVYSFHLRTGKWIRLADPSPLNYLYIVYDYGARKNKPWRRLCWTPNVNEAPGSSHTYDGLIFSRKTKTIFLYSYGPANGSCIEDKIDNYKNSPIVLGDRSAGFGWYEFNPSDEMTRDGLAPLSWRKVFNHQQLQEKRVHQSYPVSTQLGNGDIVFGSKYRTVVYDPTKPTVDSLQPFTSQADWGDGLMAYDQVHKLVWSIHEKSLLVFNGTKGNLLATYKQVVPHGKSLAFDNGGRIISWDGGSNIFIFNVDEKNPRWKLVDWGENGPQNGNRRVYGKWVYLEKYNLFAGLSIDTTGVWIYKHPKKIEPIAYSTQNLQDVLNRVKIGGAVSVAPGIYGQGLFINKSMDVDLKNVSLRGVARGKGIINVDCNDCEVTIRNFQGDGRAADCLGGNCAGIKAEGKNFKLTVKNSHINNTVMGIITDNRGGTLILQDSLIENSGLNDRSKTLGHGFYAGDINTVIVKNSIIRRSFGNGHIFKSRAANTHIENSVLAGLDGRHSRIIDFPCGGKLSVQNSVLQQGEQTDNIDVISVGTEPENCGGKVRPSEVSINNSWILIDRDESEDERSGKYGYTRLFTWRAPIKKVDVSANRIVESTGHFRFDGENKIPDMKDKNKIYPGRQAAGLGANEIPRVQ